VQLINLNIKINFCPLSTAGLIDDLGVGEYHSIRFVCLGYIYP
jgi:hypothetical protein